MTITSTYPLSHESAESRRLTLSAPVGYKQNLFQGGLWLLRPEGTLTLGTGNSALLVIAKKAGQTVAVTAQVGNNLAITHTYNGTALVLKPATDGGGVATSTPKDFETYLKGQSAVMEAFSDFVPQGTGLGVMATAAAAAAQRRSLSRRDSRSTPARRRSPSSRRTSSSNLARSGQMRRTARTHASTSAWTSPGCQQRGHGPVEQSFVHGSHSKNRTVAAAVRCCRT